MSVVTITLTAFDYSSTGIKRTEYSHDGTRGSFTRGRLSMVVRRTMKMRGTTTLYYRSIDNADDQEKKEQTVLMVDTRAPVLTRILGRPTPIPPIVLHFSATDPTPGSGVDTSTVQALFDGGTSTMSQ